MAYQTGQFTSAADLIATIKTFAQNNGWSIDGDIIYTGSVYASLTEGTGANAVVLRGGLGVSSGTLVNPCFWSGQLIDNGTYGSLSSNYPATYYLFAYTNPEIIFCMINYNVDWWQWLTFGSIVKYGTWTGGEFYCTPFSDGSANQVQFDGAWLDYADGGDFSSSALALFWSGKETWGSDDAPDGQYIHCELDGQIWGSSSREGRSDLLLVAYAPYMSSLNQYGLATWNQQAVLLPFYLFAKRPSSHCSLIGYIPNVHPIRMDNYDPGDIITIGVDKWKVFPWVRKNAYPNGSYNFGVALKYDGP